MTKLEDRYCVLMHPCSIVNANNVGPEQRRVGNDLVVTCSLGKTGRPRRYVLVVTSPVGCRLCCHMEVGPLVSGGCHHWYTLPVFRVSGMLVYGSRSAR